MGLSAPSLAFIDNRHAVSTRGDWLLELFPKNPSGVISPVRISRRGTITPNAIISIGTETIPANTHFYQRLLSTPSLTQSLWSPGQILSRSFPSFGKVRIRNQDGGMDELLPLAGWTWSGCKYRCYFADITNIQQTIFKVAEGVMGDPVPGLAEVELELFGKENQFDIPLSPYLFRGTSFMLELNGAKRVTYGSPAAANVTGSLTLKGWIWIDTSPSADVVHWGWVDGGFLPWAVVVRSTRQLRFACHVGGVAQTATTALVLGIQKFYHFAIVVSGRDVTFYIWDDDLQLKTKEIFANAISSSTRDTNVGGIYVQASTGVSVIWMDDYQVFNVAQSESEIDAARFRPSQPGALPTGLVHYPRFDDATGSTVTDSSSTAANGTITGSGGSAWLHSFEGGIELAGTAKPDLYGEKFGIKPVMVAPQVQGYCIAGGGRIQDLTSYEGGLSHSMLASSANFRTFLVTTPTAGQSLRYLPRGLFRLGSVPLLPVSVVGKGYNAGALGYVDKGGTVTRDIITRREPKLVDPTDIDTTSFTSYGTANPGIIGVYIENPDSSRVMVKDVLDRIMRSGAGSWGYVRASSLFHVEKFQGTSPAVSYRFNERRIISISPIKIETVIWKVVVRYRENFVVHAENEVAASVKGTSDWQKWTREWQEKSAEDGAIRAANQGKASSVLGIDTLLEYDNDAQSLAEYVLEKVKGKRNAWNVVVDVNGLALTTGQTVTIEIILQMLRQRLRLDGTSSYVILSMTDMSVNGKVSLQVLG